MVAASEPTCEATLCVNLSWKVKCIPELRERNHNQIMSGVPAMAQQIKDLVLPSLWCRSIPGLELPCAMGAAKKEF